MLGIKLICVGKMKEQYFIQAVNAYEKRLAAFCKFEIIELPEARVPEHAGITVINSALKKEAGEIEKKIDCTSEIIAMCVEGKSMTSEELAGFLKNCADSGKARISFIIGGSFGLHQNIKSHAGLMLSISKMTLPRHLARIVLTEQIYRSFMISGNGKYHK